MFAVHSYILFAFLAMFGLAGCGCTIPRGTASAGELVSTPTPVVFANRAEVLRVQLDGTLPFTRQKPGDKAFFASQAKVSVDADWLAYDAVYAFEPGGVLASNQLDNPLKPTPTSIGGQRVGQNVKLTLPAIAGAPLSVGFTSELRNSWSVNGFSIARKQGAGVSWSPGQTEVSLRWSGNGTTYEHSAALNCDVRGSLRVPVQSDGDLTQHMTVSGSRCTVIADGTSYKGLQARTFGLTYLWKSDKRESQASVAVIRPVLALAHTPRNLLTGYELGMSFRRIFGPWSALAKIAMRQREYAFDASPATADAQVAGAQWVTRTALQWQLAHARLSANWMRGSNPLWFAPEFGSRRDSFGLHLDLSQWIRRLVPHSNPEFAMRWNWSETQQANDLRVGGNSLNAHVAVLF